ncbi:MAG TPA: hypothetical protein DCE23_05210 [Firmicutes bacterium]|nr:hypothetical protein [Bacillota bacterium]
MSNLIFIFKAYNPNKRTTYFIHKGYTDYIANSKYVLKNPNTSHGLFGEVKEFPNIQNDDNIEPIINHIDRLAKNKVPIYRGYISLREYDAERLGYYDQDKWKNLLENRLPSIAKKMNIKLEDIQYLGAVHIEDGHPHFQFFVWSKELRINYFVKYKEINKLRNEFTNDVFREDLLPIYQEKDLAKKNITSENYILSELKKVTSDEKLLNELMKYEKDFNQTRRIRALLKDSDVRNIVDLLIDLKRDLQQTTGSIKYQYLKRYPDIIKKVDYISNIVINSSVQCQIEIEKYIKAKQKLLGFQYSDEEKLELAKVKAKEETQQEVIKLIGNQILDIERKWLKANNTYTYIKYNNESRDLLDRILTALYFQAENQNKLNRNFEMRYKKQLSKQAKKELAIKKRNASSFDWEEFE